MPSLLNKAPEPEYYTPAQVAKKYQVGVRTIQRLIAANQLSAIIITKKRIRITAEQLQEFDASRTPAKPRRKK